jgi:hypothetical protein
MTSAVDRRRLFLIMALVLGVRAVFAFFSIQAQSPTIDEPAHITAGVAYWRTGDFRMNGRDHPPLSFLLAAAPAALQGVDVPRDHPLWQEAQWRQTVRQFLYAQDFLFKTPGVSADRLINQGRWMIFLLTSLIPLAVFWAASRLGGPGAGMIAFFFSAFCPALLGHGVLVTSDGAMALFFFTACTALWRWEESRRPGWAAAAGALFGLALGSKFSAAVFCPAAFLWVVSRAKAGERRLPAFLFASALLLTITAVYRVTQWPLLLEGLRHVGGQLAAGRNSFLLGHIRQGGVWHYFLTAFAVKTPLAALFAALFSSIALFRRKEPFPLLLWAPPLLYFLAASAGRFQIGHRHILPVYPFLYVFIGVGLAPWISDARTRSALLALIAWMGKALVESAPYPLAYFNEAVGGSDRGYQILTDSNVDWGQGLKALKKHLTEEGVETFYFSWFGSYDPAAYGLRFVGVFPVSPAPVGDDAVDPLREEKVRLVVSATNYQGTYFRDPAVFQWLHHRKPVAVVARSLLVFDLTDDVDGLQRLAGVLLAEGKERKALDCLARADALGKKNF